MTAPDRLAASLIVARNDLEAVWLAAFARRVGMRVVAFDDLKWGGVVPLADPCLSDLEDTVLIAELPAPDFERQLRDRGHRVHVLHHHVWIMPDGTLLGRSAPLSTLEQVLRLAPSLSAAPEAGKLGQAGVSALVAANDRAFIPGLAAAARALAPVDEAAALGWTRAVRLLDLAMRLGAPPDAAERGLDALADMDPSRGEDAPAVVRTCVGEAAGAADDALNGTIDLLAGSWEEDRLTHACPRQGAVEDGVWIVHAPDRHGAVLMDALYAHLADGAFDGLTVTREVVAILHAPDAPRSASRVEFSGRSKSPRIGRGADDGTSRGAPGRCGPVLRRRP